MSSKNPIRLPPLKVLRVRNTSRTEANPCLAIMSSVLGTHLPSPLPPRQTKDRKAKTHVLTEEKTACWASAGYHGRGCSTVEQALRACTDAPAPPKKSSSTINYHLGRFSKRLIAQGRRK